MNFLFLKLAFRNILKNRLNAFINILALQLASPPVFFIFLFINYETGFDDFQSNKERIFRVMGAFNSDDR
ncbi:hypothetical protein GM418_13715 [Maribellus comscasis]|uniref:ABC transporter permease n=1 Tax=Maribellus comscasis TaxID=2681766 RepID=A0A6I6JP13_9BACT|nr:hypothetical protein [Maribellus comscasis]QGY44685.1 hypothetical protein GM418_13715 [Maribellus comscasis]